MARRINLLLVRHALSGANLDKSLNHRLPDQRIPLADIGHDQAIEAGKFLAGFLSQPDQTRGKTRILCSPYLRARQTSAGIEQVLNEHDIVFDKREEIALREISFGLFDGFADNELQEHFPLEHSWYQKHLEVEKSNGADGEFWAAMPMGESRAQVADRVKGVFGTILRDADPDRADPVQNFIIVSHGVTIRTFIMQWLHHEFEWYARQTNPDNCSVNLISSNGKSPYEHRLVFPGFRHKRTTAQDVRENGNLETAL